MRDRDVPGGSSETAAFQGLGNTDPAEDASMLVPKVLTWFPSFLWCSVLDCGGQRGKGLHLKGGF